MIHFETVETIATRSSLVLCLSLALAGCSGGVVGETCSPGFVACQGRCVADDGLNACSPPGSGAVGASGGAFGSGLGGAASTPGAAGNGSAAAVGVGGSGAGAGFGAGMGGKAGSTGASGNTGVGSGGNGSSGSSAAGGASAGWGSAGSGSGAAGSVGVGSSGGASAASGGSTGVGGASASGGATIGGGSTTGQGGGPEIGGAAGTGGNGQAGFSAAGGAAGAGGSGPECAPPLVLCGGTCIDVASDESNCGGCGVTCSTGVCQSGECVNAGVGHQVLIGMDYAAVPAWHTEERKVLGNAVFLGAIAAKGAWRVIGFDPFSSPSATAVDGIVAAQAASHGVSALTVTHVGTKGELIATLSKKTFDAVVVYDASAASVAAASDAGSATGGTLGAFAKAGGVVIILGSAKGPMGVFTAQAGIAPIASLVPVASATPLTNVAPADAVAQGVATVFSAPSQTVGWTMLGATPTFETVITAASNDQAVVLHAVVAP